MDTIIVEKINEVYAKIKCDPGIIHEISDHFTFNVPGAKFMPSYKNKIWDGKIRLVNTLTGIFYAGLIDELSDFCIKRNYYLDLSNIETDKEFSLIETDEYIKTLDLPSNITPRDYQIDALAHMIRKKRGLLLSPTASGKSLIIYMLTQYYREKTLIIVPTTQLVHQMVSDFETYGLDEKYCQKIMSGYEKDSNKPIVVSTWQSIYKMPKAWFNKFKLVVGDEAHGFKSKSLISIMTKLENCKYRYGLTGTLDGTQTHKLVLEGLFGRVYKVVSTSELINKKTLAEFKIKALILKYNDDIRMKYAKETYQNEIDFIVTNEKRNKLIKNLALSLDGNVLIFFNYVDKQGKPLYNLIKDSTDRDVFYISGEVDSHDREIIRKSIEQKKNTITVASLGTTSTGTNIVQLDYIIFATPSKSRIKILQSIGRVLRKSETKLHATLFDIADDLSWKSKKNYTLEHFLERIQLYNSEDFPYKVYTIDL